MAVAAVILVGGLWLVGVDPSAEGAVDEAAWPAAARVVDVTRCGVVGDGVTMNTAAIQATIDGLGPAGGTLRFPPGMYVTGTVQLRDNVTLRVTRGAVLLGALDPAQYRAVDPFRSGDGATRGHALIVADHAHHVGLVGWGTVDGRGAQLSAVRGSPVHPALCRWVGCDGVVVSGVHLVDPAAWTVHFDRCHHVRCRGVTIRSDSEAVGNTDGIDVDSCQDVRLFGCDIRSGDDAVCLKTTSHLPCRNVVVANCRLMTRCNGVKIGTETVGDVEHVRVRGCTMTDVGAAGLAVYSVDGAAVRDVAVFDVQMRNVGTPIHVRLGSRLHTFRDGQRPQSTGAIENVRFRGVRATGATQRTAVVVSGLPGHQVGPIALADVHLTAAGGGTAADAHRPVAERPADYPTHDMFGHTLPASGLFLRHVHGLTLSDVTTATDDHDDRPVQVQVDVQP